MKHEMFSETETVAFARFSFRRRAWGAKVAGGEVGPARIGRFGGRGAPC